MGIEEITAIIALIIAGASSTLSVYINLDRKVQENKMKLEFHQDEIKDLKHRVTGAELKLQETLDEIKDSIHKIAIQIEQIKK